MLLKQIASMFVCIYGPCAEHQLMAGFYGVQVELKDG